MTTACWCVTRATRATIPSVLNLSCPLFPRMGGSARWVAGWGMKMERWVVGEDGGMDGG